MNHQAKTQGAKKAKREVGEPQPSIFDRSWICDRETLDTKFALDLDAGIRRAVVVLLNHGVETYESCQGGPRHCYLEPTVRFWGGTAAGYEAFNVAVQHGLPVKQLSRFYSVEDNQLVGPHWEMTFWDVDHARTRKRS